MILEGYGIRLLRLKEGDIELVRKWRNSPTVNQHMIFREEISAEQQKFWFASINTIHNNYFVIEADGKKIGLINGSQIDWEKKETNSGGIFIWDESYRESITPISAALLLTDLSVILGLKRTHAKVLDENTNAANFNKLLGYQWVSDDSENGAKNYILETDEYILHREKLRQKLFRKVPSFVVKIVVENADDDLTQFYLKRLKTSEFPNDFELIV